MAWANAVRVPESRQVQSGSLHTAVAPHTEDKGLGYPPSWGAGGSGGMG